MISQEHIEQNLLSFLKDNEQQNGPLDPNLDLIENEVLDSLLMMDLIAYIEGEYNIRIENSELAPKNFRTVSALAALIAGKQNQQVTG